LRRLKRFGTGVRADFIMPLIIAVFGTNVLVSALCFPGSLPADLLRRWLARQFVLVLSEQILAELLNVLSRPKIARRFAITDQQALTFVQVLRDIAVITLGELTVEAVPRDSKDNMVVACALEGKAGYIVSGDTHLKELKEYRGIRIISPAEFQFLLLQTGTASASTE